MGYIMVCAVHMPLPRFKVGVGHGLYNGLRCARATASVCGRGGATSIRMACALHVPLPRFAVGVGYYYNNSLRCARAAASV